MEPETFDKYERSVIAFRNAEYDVALACFDKVMSSIAPYETGRS